MLLFSENKYIHIQFIASKQNRFEIWQSEDFFSVINANSLQVWKLFNVTVFFFCGEGT